MNDSRINLRDGRELAFTELGDAAGEAIFYFHAAPDSRFSAVSLEAAFEARALRVISPERPGYGGSSPQPGRTMADWPVDVRRLADALGIDRFVVSGHSSGGPYAVACAALLPDRVSGAIVVAGVTDPAWPGAWEGGFESEIAMMRLPDEASVLARCQELFGQDGSGFLNASGFELSGPDQALLDDEKESAAMLTSLAEAFRQGVAGYAQDVFVQGRAWPFDPAGIRAPVVVLHGELDTVVPVAHSRHTAARIPGSSLRILPGHGHLTIAAVLPEVCAELVRTGA